MARDAADTDLDDVGFDDFITKHALTIDIVGLYRAQSEPCPEPIFR